MKRLVLGLLVGTAALAPALAWGQMRAQDEVVEDGSGRVREPRVERASPAERAERRQARQERRAERQATSGDADLGAGAPADRPRRDRDGDGVPDRRERRLDGDGIRTTRPDRMVERPDAQVSPARGDRDGDGVPDRRERRLDGDGMRTARPDRMSERPDAQVFPPRRERDIAERRAERPDRRDARRDRRDDRFNDRQDYRNDRQEARRDFRDDYRDDRRDDRVRSGWGRSAYGGGLVWNRGWRNDGRYDWNRHRQYDRNAFRLPRYYAPGGYSYGYRRFGVGVGLSRSFYGESYWIDDPYSYRLPPAYGPYRWVRYWGDALLVDLRTGRVVDAVYDIFY